MAVAEFFCLDRVDLLLISHRAHQHVALKVFTRDHQNDGEIKTYVHISEGRSSHIGKRFVRTALDSFVIPRTGRNHHCLVHVPLWGSLRDMILRNPCRDRFTEQLLRVTLKCLLQALDYLHTDRKIVHTVEYLESLILVFLLIVCFCRHESQ